MIGLIDAKSGNIGSLKNALEYLNIKYVVITKQNQLLSGMKLILPGVGSFHTLMANLNELDLVNPIKQSINQKTPFLGICVGMQVLLSTGWERKKTTGLGIIDGQVVKIRKSKDIKVPIVSWIKLEPSKEKKRNNILLNCKELSFYFSHSFYCDTQEEQDVVAYTEYNKMKYPAIINRDNVYGVQFHPEKSRDSGLQVIKNFSELS